MLLVSWLKYLPDPRSQKFSPSTLMALGSVFRFMIHPELTFVYGVRYGTKFSLVLFCLFVYGDATIPALFVEKVVLSPLNCLYL